LATKKYKDQSKFSSSSLLFDQPLTTPTTMMQISETILLFASAAVTLVSGLFCLISLVTPRWNILTGLFCTGCSTPSAGLSIVALLSLMLTVVVLALFALKKLPKSIRALALGMLFLATMFTLAAHAAYFDDYTGYSYKLMVFANFLCYMASLLVAFWLGGSYAAAIVQDN
jgi:hypothetical protein